jgi:outer membrane murein-binding lipoprotein Lpp
MSWVETMPWWLPAALAAALAALAVFALAGQPWRPAKPYWIAALAVVGALAIAAGFAQQKASRAALGQETARLREVAAHLDELGRLLQAGPGTTPDQTFDTVAAAIKSLNAKIKDLERQVHALQEKTRSRTIDPDTAAKMAEHLRQFGNHRVVVSCVPADVEAYNYANQIANALREAGWEALGPETTTIFGETAAAMGVSLYVRGGAAPPEAATLLLDAFTRFNIPYQSGITPSEAIPDPATVELFVGHKP